VANKALFGGAQAPGKTIPATDTTNKAGGRAYAFAPEHALAQLAATGTFNGTFYGTGQDQLKAIREAADGCSPEFIAQTAVWARSKGFMKDMPAALTVMLTKADPKLADAVFAAVIDNGKMLRNFVQMIRSGAFGRKSLGSGPKRLVQRWFSQRTDEAIFRASIGNSPSLGDILALTHPKPETESRKALYGYIRGVDATDGKGTVRYNPAALPDLVKQFESFKKGETAEVPNLDFRFLSSLPLTAEQWATIAERGGWQMVRMNLNTFARHKAFDVPGLTDKVAAKLADEAEIAKARAFPYQLFAAFVNTDEAVPQKIRLALQDAAEIATKNVETYETPVAICVDVSGSMSSAITGVRKGATSKMRVIDVAAFIGATLCRRNPESVLVPVDTSVHGTSKINPRDSIMTIADQLRRFGGGGTSLSEAIKHLNAKKFEGKLIVMVSDNESWVDGQGASQFAGTATMQEFRKYQKRVPDAKLVCIDLQPYGSTQAPDAPNEVLNIGGFSDAVFETIGKFVRGNQIEQIDWVSEIKKVVVGKAPHTDGAEDEDETPTAG
jgi:60 kDa SS-A/Ro ribonucleoprotein